MTIPLDTQGGGVFGGVSPEPLGGWSIVRCLFRERARRGGGESDSYLRAVVVVPLDRRQAKNDQGSLFV